MGREVIKTETVGFWLALCAAAALPLMFGDSLLIYLLYDCWPIRSAAVSGCLDHVPGYGWHLAVVFGGAFAAGSAVAWWKRGNPSE